MAVQIDSANVVGDNWGYANPITTAFTVADNPNSVLLVFGVNRENSTNASSVTYASQNLTYYGNLGNVFLYYMVNPPVGTANVVWTNGGAWAGRNIIATLYNCKQSDFIRDTDAIYNPGDGTTVFNPSVTTVNGDMTLCIATGATTTITPDAGTTEEDTGADFVNSLFSKPSTSTTTTMQLTYNNAGTIKHIEMYSFEEAEPSTSTPNPIQLNGNINLQYLRTIWN